MKNRRIAFFRWLLPLLLMQLAACGFHLRGAVELPSVMQKTFISGGEGSELYYAVENALENAGARVVNSAASATAILSLHSQRIDRRVISVDTQGRAAEYELSLLVSFSLRDSTGRYIASNEQVSVIRDFSFDPDNVLAKDQEEAALRSEMNRFAVAQMMRRLQALSRHSSTAAGE